MAKAKNTFLRSKMNKDLDARIIPSGEYRNAINVQVNKSEGDQVGSLENVLGNTEVANVGTHTGYAGTLHCIGQVVDDSNGVAYLFYTSGSLSVNNYSPNAKNYIIRFDSKSNSLTTLVEGAFLNFSSHNPIYGVNVLENLLFWTDNRNQPRKINLDLANPSEVLNPSYYTTEDQISVAKYNPYAPIEMYAESVLSPGDYETTMKDVSSFYMPNGGQGVIKDSVTAGDSQVNLSTFKGDIIEAGGAYGATGATVSYTTQSNPPEIITVTGVTVDTFFYNDAVTPPVWEITVTGGTLPDLDPTTQDIVLNANPYYDKDYAGDPTYLEDKFVRFGYRFKFDDDEYSLFSTFTQAAFIPKQDGYFMYVKKPEADNIQDINDQDAAFRSTTVSFVENKVDNIKLRTPLPFNNYELESSLKIKSIDLLYKESDGIPVKVIDTIDISKVFSSAAICDVSADNLTPFTTVNVDNIRGGINAGDLVTGSGISTAVTVVSYTPDDPNQNPSTSGIIELSSAQTLTEDTVLTVGEPEYYTYDYQAKKPFKTLPEKDLIRVYDKIPVRSFAQEVSGNRVIYGNFQNKHTAPDSLNYNVGITEKSLFNKNESTIDYTGAGGVFPPGTPIDVDFSGELYAGRVITSTDPNVVIPDGTVVSSTNNNGEGVSVSGNSTFASGGTATILVNNLNGFIPVGATVSSDTGVPVGTTVVSIQSQTQSEASLTVSQLISFTTGEGFTFTSSSKTEAVISLSREVTFPAGPVALYLNPGSDIQETTSIIEYPNHSLKTNRNYQVGVVLSDRFGRQSGVILSNNKELKTINGNKFIGSTVYSPYNTENIDPDEWRGNSLKVSFNETIGTSLDRAMGIPGVYNGDPTSGDYNPLGWYTFKIVVKQTEQEYYNVYLPGIMAAYPEDTTLEVGNTSHVVLISDNINKVPRDLSEIGPVQDQFRSSVQLYGRVENSSTEVSEAGTNIGLSNIQYYPGRTFDTASTVSTVADLFDFNPQDPPNPNLFPQFYSLESNPYIARINTANKIGQIANVNFNAVSATISVTESSDTLRISSISGDAADIEIGDKVVGTGFPTDLVVFGSGFQQGNASGQNWEVDASGFTGTSIDFVALSGTNPIVVGDIMDVQTGVPEGTIVLSITVDGTPGVDPLTVVVNNIVALDGGDLVSFTEPSTLQVSTPVSVTLGDEINVYSSESPGIQFLAVYETEPVSSLLDIFWETSTTGRIQDLNDIITNENPTGTGGDISNWNDNTFTEALRTGENVLNAPIYLVDNFGATISSNDINTPLSLDSAIDDNGLNVQTVNGDSNPAFYLEETAAGSFEYNLKVGAGFSTIYYGLDEGARNFTLAFSAEVNGLPTGPITRSLSLGNVSPHIPTFNANSYSFRSLKPQTGVTDIKVYTGPESVPTGLDVTSAGFPAGTTVVSYSPVGDPLTPWGIKDSVVDSFTYVTYFMFGNLGDILYLSPSYIGDVPDGTYVTNIQVDTPVAGQITVTVSKEVTIAAFNPSGTKIAYRTPGNLEVSASVDVVEDQSITASNTSDIWDDCPLPPFYPGGTNVRYIGELKAVNGKGWRADDTLPLFGPKTKDLTFNITQERRGVGTPGEEVISPGYFDLENPGVAPFGTAAKIDLVNTGYQNTSMPNDVYTIDFEVSDPGDTRACQVTVNTGIVICAVQEWTLSGFYSTSCTSNQSSGTPYEGKFIFVQVCDPSGMFPPFGEDFNGWYAYLSGSNTANFTGDFPSWNNLISSNGSSNLTISPSGGTGTANFATSGWTARSFSLDSLKNLIDSNEEITGGCLVYDNPGPVWTLTAGDGSSTPLVPARSNYLFTIA